MPRRPVVIATAVLTASLAATLGTASAGPAVAAGRASVTVGLVGGASGFNPNTAEGADQSVVAVVEELLPSAFHSRGLGVPAMDTDLLASAKVTSTKPMKVTYRINARASWSDGVPIDAADFILAWRAQNGRDARYAAASTAGYDDITAVAPSAGGKTVTVTFRKTFAGWRSLFSFLIPAHLVHSASQWNTAFNKKLPISGGPFLMRSASVTGVQLIRNPHWYGKAAKLSALAFRYLSDESSLAEAMAAHEIQIAQPDLEANVFTAYNQIPGVKVSVTTGPTFDHLDLNTHDPLLNDVAVRHAIGLALDPAPVAATAKGGYGVDVAETHNRLLLAGQPGGKDTRGIYGHGDVPDAVTTLTADGWTRGSDGVFVKNGQRLAFTIKTTNNNAVRTVEAVALVNELGAAGFDVSTDAEAPSTLFPSLEGHNFQASLFAWVGTGADDAGASQSIYATGEPSNFGYLSDPKVDSELASATTELDQGKQNADLNAADAQMWNDCVTFPLLQKPSLLAVFTAVRGVHDETGGDSFTDGAAGWSVG